MRRIGQRKAKKYEKALINIAAVLGPNPGCSVNGCEGCKYEMQEALSSVEEALGKRYPWTVHENGQGEWNA